MKLFLEISEEFQFDFLVIPIFLETAEQTVMQNKLCYTLNQEFGESPLSLILNIKFLVSFSVCL